MNPRMDEFLRAVAALRRGMFPVEADRPEVSMRRPGAQQETVICNGKSGMDEFEVRPAHPQSQMSYEQYRDQLRSDIASACDGLPKDMAPNPWVGIHEKLVKDGADKAITKVHEEIKKAHAKLVTLKQERRRAAMGIEKLVKYPGDPVILKTEDDRLIFTGLVIPDDTEVYYSAANNEVAYYNPNEDAPATLVPLFMPVGRDSDGNYKPLDKIEYEKEGTPTMPVMFEFKLASGLVGRGRTAEEAESYARQAEHEFYAQKHATPLSDILALREKWKGMSTPLVKEEPACPVCTHPTVIDGRCAQCLLPM